MDSDNKAGDVPDPGPDRVRVTCASCGAIFTSFMGMPTQAFRCASEVAADRLTGHYGTTLIDFKRFEITDRPIWLADGTTCDDCVQRLLDADVLKLVDDHVW